MKIMKSILCALALLTIAAISSCDNDPAPDLAAGANGFYVVNEGAFGNNNGSISFYDRDKDEMINDIFQSKNGRSLGDQTQSMTLHEGKGYIVVQGSSKLEVIDLSNNASVKTITDGIESPRYFVGISETKGYLSDWGSDGVTGTVKVIDLATLEVTKSIPVGHGANTMLRVGNRLYVANAGGFAKDNTVKVINIETDAVIATAIVGDNPYALQQDKDGNLWVACAGYIVYNQDFSIDETLSTKPELTKLNSELAELASFPFNKIDYGNLTQLEISPTGDKIYYNYDNGIYAMDVSASTLPTTPLISKWYYGLDVDPFTGDIIGCAVVDFSSAGKIEVHDAGGTLKQTYTVGIAPNGCAF